MDEISVVMYQFQTAIKVAMEAEVRRQVGELIANRPVVATAPVVEKRKGPKTGTIAAAKPCPTCGELNKARRFRFYCAAHRG